MSGNAVRLSSLSFRPEQGSVVFVSPQGYGDESAVMRTGVCVWGAGAPGRLTVRELSGWWICCEAARACGGFWLPVFSWRRLQGRGDDFVFLSCRKRLVPLAPDREWCIAPLAPGRGEGSGVRGELPLIRVCRSLGFSPRSAWRGCFSGMFF